MPSAGDERAICTAAELHHEVNTIEDRTDPTLAERPLADATTRLLVRQAVQRTVALLKKEAELAKAEFRADLQQEVSMARQLGLAAICALTTLNLLLVAAVLALANTMPGWLAALTVAGPVLVAGIVFGIVGWARRVKNPLEKTRRSLEEDVRWVKQRMA